MLVHQRRSSECRRRRFEQDPGRGAWHASQRDVERGRSARSSWRRCPSTFDGAERRQRKRVLGIPVILDLNNAVLAAGGSDWKDWRKFNFAKIRKVDADALRARAKEALAEEFGDVGFAVMKDPRMCRLMPFWGPVFAEAKWSVRVLLPIRSPLEVSQSLTLPRRPWPRLRVLALATPRPGRRG